jgi:hypothetical protein
MGGFVTDFYISYQPQKVARNANEVPIIKEVLNNSSLNDKNTNRINAILSGSSFSKAYLPLTMATHPCVAETLN